jgi:transposase
MSAAICAPNFQGSPVTHRCVELLPRCAVPLAALFTSLKGECDGISLVDATALAVCDNRRISRHKVFKGIAARGKTYMGWFYGFKLYVIINSKGELIRLKLTPGNVDDRKPMPALSHGIFGQLFADKGYLGKGLTEILGKQGIQLITPLRKNRKPVPRTDFEKAILRQRALIETVFDELKNLCQVEHTRHRLMYQHFPDTRLSRFMQQFVVNRRQIAIGGMKSLAVVKHFDIFEHCLSSLSSGLIGLLMHQFGFQGMEEAF